MSIICTKSGIKSKCNDSLVRFDAAYRSFNGFAKHGKLRARFGITCAMEYYDTPTLVNIVKRSANILKVSIEQDAAYEIALRSRGTPRIANSLLRRVRDFAQVMGSGSIDLAIARYALDALNIDKRGLDAIDNKILKTIITKFKLGL